MPTRTGKRIYKNNGLLKKVSLSRNGGLMANIIDSPCPVNARESSNFG